MKWKFTFDNFTEAYWGSRTENVSFDFGVEDFSIEEVDFSKGISVYGIDTYGFEDIGIVKNVDLAKLDTISLEDIGIVKNVDLAKLDTISFEELMLKAVDKDLGLEAFSLEDIGILKHVGKWIGIVWHGFTYDVFTGNSFTTMSLDIRKYDDFMVVDDGILKNVEVKKIDTYELEEEISKLIDIMVSDEFEVKDIGIVKHVELVKVDEYSLEELFEKHILIIVDGDNFDVEDFEITTKKGRLPVIRFRVKMFPTVQYNVKHERVMSNDFEGW